MNIFNSSNLQRFIEIIVIMDKTHVHIKKFVDIFVLTYPNSKKILNTNHIHPILESKKSSCELFLFYLKNLDKNEAVFSRLFPLVINFQDLETTKLFIGKFIFDIP